MAESTSLGKDDLLTILNELCGIASKWEVLATCFELSDSDIANIRSTYGSDVNLALKQVILRWMATNHQDQLTWSNVVKALRESILNEEFCASQIEKKFFTHHPTPCKLQRNAIQIEY